MILSGQAKMDPMPDFMGHGRFIQSLLRISQVRPTESRPERTPDAEDPPRDEKGVAPSPLESPCIVLIKK